MPIFYTDSIFVIEKFQVNNKGFTLIETLVTVAVVGIVSAIAIGSYKAKFPTAQVKEPVNMLEQQRLTIATGISQGYCTPNNDPITMKGKYGVITVSGTLKPSAGKSCPSGCQAKYTFNGSDVSKELQGKIIVVDVLNNLKMSKVTAQTTVDDKYLPKNLIAYSVNAGDSCTAIAATTATATSGGGTSGTEDAVANGSVIPGEPVVPTPTPTTPTNPDGGTSTTPTTTTTTASPGGETGTSKPQPSDPTTTTQGCFATSYGSVVCMLRVKNPDMLLLLLEGGSGGLLGTTASTGGIFNWISTHLNCSIVQQQINDRKSMAYEDLVKLQLFPKCAAEYGVANPYPNIK